MGETQCLAGRLFKRGVRRISRDRTVPTTREREVLKMLVKGRSTREIACDLNLSVYTVMSHKVSLMRKFCVHTREKLVQDAIERGIIEPPSTQ
jgi:DNA-binding NarL/FixJ family response regulator